MIDINEVEKWGQLCSICGKPVRYWHDQLSKEDEFSTTWHKNCAKDYKEWLRKMTRVLPTEPTYMSKPLRWDLYFNDYQRRQKELLERK